MTTLRVLPPRHGVHRADLRSTDYRWTAFGTSAASAALQAWDARTVAHAALANGGRDAQAERLNEKHGTEAGRFVSAGTHLAYVPATGRARMLHINPPTAWERYTL